MAGYTRQDTADNIADTKTIDAADLDAEFDAVEAAFNNSTGHSHDGTAAEGAPIEVTGPNQEYLSEAAQFRPKTDDTYDLGSATFQWKDLYVDGTANIDSLVADTANIDGGTIDNAVIGGTTPAAGSFTTVSATGNITVGGTVDGRDVAADGTKLDGIEAGADVTDTANVTAAGALMDSELTNIAAVKALDQGVATTDSPTFAAITVTGNVDGRDVSVDGTKLDTIETNADVTDTANVTAAGALMDSELTNIAAVKALDQGVATTDSPTFSQVYVGNGSAAAPSFAFNGDTNTGLYRSAADELSISTNGAERMRIDSSGNVGIGTNSPSQRLSVSGSISATESLTIGSTGSPNTSVSGVLTQDRGFSISAGLSSPVLLTGNQSPISANLRDVGLAGSNVVFQTGSSTGTSAAEQMRIDSSGDVGIGTVSPSSKLDVNGDVTITDKIIHSGDTNTSIRFPANDTFTVETAGSERMRINSSGNVGIGTSSPTHSLSVENGTGSHVKLTRTGVNSFELGVVSGNALVFYDNGTERMRITSSGNVGIGTNSPSSKLDVNGDVTTNNIYVGDGSAAAPSFAFEADTNTGLYRRTADELNISVGGSENFRFVGDHGYSSSGTGTNLSQVGSGYTTVTSITFTAKSTTALAVGMIRGYSASALSYIYSYVNIGGTSGKVAAGQYSNLASNGNETLTPLVMVTGLTVGASYTAYLYGANGGSITNSYDFELAIYS